MSGSSFFIGSYQLEKKHLRQLDAAEAVFGADKMGNQTKPTISGDKEFYLIGQIYNYQNQIEHVIDCYNQYGDSFTNHFNGDFLIVIVDNILNVIDFYIDPWMTRNLYYKNDIEGWSFCTFNHGFVGTQRLNPNSSYRFYIDDCKLECTQNYTLNKWNLEQHKDTLDDVKEAVKQAIISRYNEDAVILLSAGMDSGVVATVLHDAGLYAPCISIDVGQGEDQKALQEVKEYCSNNEYIDFKTEHLLSQYKNDVLLSLGNFVKHKLDKSTMLAGNSISLHQSYKKIFASTYERKDIYISPQIPDDLTEVFPWSDFYDGAVEKLLRIWEPKTLANGINVKHCFLDKIFVQEFLNLTTRLKNARPKNFLMCMLEDRGLTPTKKNVPFPHSNLIGPRANSEILRLYGMQNENKIIRNISYTKISDYID